MFAITAVMVQVPSHGEMMR